MEADAREGGGLCHRQQPSDPQHMGTAFNPAKTSPASWNAFSDVDAFVDAVLAELAAMAADGTRRPRSGPKPTLTRLSREWGSSAEQAMTGRMFQRLGTEDEVGFALGQVLTCWRSFVA